MKFLARFYYRESEDTLRCIEWIGTRWVYSALINLATWNEARNMYEKSKWYWTTLDSSTVSFDELRQRFIPSTDILLCEVTD